MTAARCRVDRLCAAKDSGVYLFRHTDDRTRQRADPAPDSRVMSRRSPPGPRWASAKVALCVGSFPLLLACAAENPVRNDAVARIGSEEVAYAEFEAQLRSGLEGSELALTSEVLSELFDRYLEGRLLLQLARERGLDLATSDVSSAAMELMASHDESNVDAADVAAYYEANREQYRRPERVHLRQILVHEREQAEAAAQALAQGEDFAQVAARFSKEPNADMGGDQGELSREDLPPPFVDTIFALSAGEVSGIVEADYGLHLFQVLARFPAEVVPLRQAAPGIRRRLMEQRLAAEMQQLVAEAQERYDVQIFSQNFPFEYRGRHARSEQP